MTVLSSPVARRQEVLPTELARFLTAWLGVWPSPGRLRVVPSARRVVAGWDGRPHPFMGVAADSRYGHATVLSVPPLRLPAVRALVDDLTGRGDLRDRGLLAELLPAAVGHPDRTCAEACFRWTTAPTRMRHIGRWQRSDDVDTPPWLRAFDSPVLVATDRRGRYQAGVGIKRHNSFGHEIAVGTEPAARGRGLARALVAQAADHILSYGALPIYLHDGSNAASARVAAAAGFPPSAWTWLGLADT